jgi:serine/threonine-protein kinase RIO1
MRCSGSGSIQVQHPGAERLMMVDIRNMQAFALFLQKYDINFDMFSATKEMEKQVSIHSNSIVVCSRNTIIYTPS